VIGRGTRSSALVALLSAGVVAPTFAQDGAKAPAPIPHALIEHRPSISVTKQTGTFGGQTVAYTATVEEHILEGPDSIPNAFLVTIAYVRDGIADRARRPVAFAFNGGPGASSSPLHFSGIGPRIGSRDGGVANNPNSILDATDLVFIDPVGTGFSRPYTTDIGKQFYWNVAGDVGSVAQVIRAWLRENGRESAPRYLIGESYGATRIGEILRRHKDLKIDGVVLVSAVGSTGAGDIAYAKNIPSMAVSAWYHEKIPRNRRTVDQVWAEAIDFVKSDYIPAMAKKDSLTPNEKMRLAERIASFTGLPAAFVEDKNLRLSPQDWLMNIMKDKGLRVSNQDTRATGPLVLTAERAAASSPAEGLGGTGIGTAMQAPAIVPGSEPAAGQQRPSTLENYLKQDLQFKTLESYRSLNLDINGFWHLGTNANIEAAPGVAEGMRANPKMRMFWIQGYFDLNTPAYGALYSYEQAGLTGDRVTGVMTPGPHTAFATDESKQLLAAALRKWIR
jgi:carboxypeptidase C (cathepsin A)